ncbi:hypothetical protein VUR80DRAFT_1934 [Thermomyces stellatus]
MERGIALALLSILKRGLGRREERVVGLDGEVNLCGDFDLGDIRGKLCAVATADWAVGRQSLRVGALAGLPYGGRWRIHFHHGLHLIQGLRPRARLRLPDPHLGPGRRCHCGDVADVERPEAGRPIVDGLEVGGFPRGLLAERLPPSGRGVGRAIRDVAAVRPPSLGRLSFVLGPLPTRGLPQGVCLEVRRPLGSFKTLALREHERCLGRSLPFLGGLLALNAHRSSVTLVLGVTAQPVRN